MGASVTLCVGCVLVVGGGTFCRY